MSSRFVAIDEGPDITLDRAMVVVGRHPNCDTRLNSLRVSRHHCCMTRENDQVVVRDLGSTNGIRINGMRVETGRLMGCSPFFGPLQMGVRHIIRTDATVL
jgi:pSer/pThr/pTyr-binding forkhead associated (FHA) protein